MGLHRMDGDQGLGGALTQDTLYAASGGSRQMFFDSPVVYNFSVLPSNSHQCPTWQEMGSLAFPGEPGEETLVFIAA